MSCSIIIICFCCSPHHIKMPRFTNRYPVENSSSSTASLKLEMVENSQASWLGSHKSQIAKVTISEQDEKVGRRFFALILLQQILFSSVSFHVFLPVVKYNQLPHSWGLLICVPLGWSSMIADGVVGRVQIRKHTETHADTLTQSNLDECHCTCTTTTDLWSQQQAYLCMQVHHQTLDYCCRTYTTTDICDHNKQAYLCRIIKTLTATLVQQQICVITTTSIPMYAGSSSNPWLLPPQHLYSNRDLWSQQEAICKSICHCQSVGTFDPWSSSSIVVATTTTTPEWCMQEAPAPEEYRLQSILAALSLSLSLSLSHQMMFSSTQKRFHSSGWCTSSSGMPADSVILFLSSTSCFLCFLCFQRLQFGFPLFFVVVAMRQTETHHWSGKCAICDFSQSAAAAVFVCEKLCKSAASCASFLPSFLPSSLSWQCDKNTRPRVAHLGTHLVRASFQTSSFFPFLLFSGTLFLLSTRLLPVDSWTCKIVVISLVSSKRERESSSRSIRTSSRRCSCTSCALTISPWRRARLKQIVCCFNRKDHLHLTASRLRRRTLISCHRRSSCPIRSSSSSSSR